MPPYFCKVFLMIIVLKMEVFEANFKSKSCNSIFMKLGMVWSHVNNREFAKEEKILLQRYLGYNRQSCI